MKYEVPKDECVTPNNGNESGRIGYIIAWLLGVPTSALFFLFLVRGH